MGDLPGSPGAASTFFIPFSNFQVFNSRSNINHVIVINILRLGFQLYPTVRIFQPDPQLLIINPDKASQEESEVNFFDSFLKRVLPQKKFKFKGTNIKNKRDKRERDQRWTVKILRSSTKVEVG